MGKKQIPPGERVRVNLAAERAVSATDKDRDKDRDKDSDQGPDKESPQSAQIADIAAQALVAAKQLRIKTKPLEHFVLAPAQRDVLLVVPGISKAIRNKLAKDSSLLNVSDVVSMTMALADELRTGAPPKQRALQLVAQHLTDCLQKGIAGLAVPSGKSSGKVETKASPAGNTLYQFKITLIGIRPPIWRRMQVQDCTLDTLHAHIQTAMGWTNSHLHEFEIKGVRYGDLELLDDGFDESACVDSTTTMLSDIVPTDGKRFTFKYEYDFGDCWQHEVLFEGCPTLEKGKKYPLCLEGERACPPEDVGGIWGYQGFLSAISDPRHDEHENYLEWCGGSFAPDHFDSKRATRRMKKGLPDWRKM